MRIAILIFTVLALLPKPTIAEQTVRVIEPWARAVILVSRPAAAYLTIESTRDDRLRSVASPVADRIVLHAIENNDEVSRMVLVDTLEIPAGKSIVLAPGGIHLMLTGLNKKLTEGMRFPMTLKFERAGEITVTVPVLDIGAQGIPKDATP